MCALFELPDVYATQIYTYQLYKMAICFKLFALVFGKVAFLHLAVDLAQNKVWILIRRHSVLQFLFAS